MLKEHDQIVSVDGKRISDPLEVEQLLQVPLFKVTLSIT
jgi:hypothetical protein